MAAYATDSDLTTRFPATAAATLAQRTTALDDAEQQIDLDAFTGQATRAHALLAAHFLVVSGAIAGASEAGPVTSMRAGEISATFGGTFGDVDPLLGTTTYGRQFIQIRDGLVSRPVVG